MDERLFTLPDRLVARYSTRDPFLIADRMGYMVRFSELKKQKGFCTNILNNYFIFINGNLSMQMKRMTCAHELGHIIFHRDMLGRNGQRRNFVEMELFDITSSTEYEANLFAANLLIDTDEMLGYLRDGYDLVAAASALDVNVNMLAIKLLEMKELKKLLPELPFSIDRRFLGRIGDSSGAM